MLKNMFCAAAMVLLLMAAGDAAWADDARANGAAAGGTVTNSAVAEQTTYLADFSAQAKKDWPHNRRMMVVCHGHSVPAGYAATPEVRTFDAYPMLLHQKLAEKFPHGVINVVTSAVGGENCTKGAKRFDDDVLALKPDVVTIDYALNDRGLPLKTSRAAWAEMIEKCQSHNIKVILLTPTPDIKAKLDDPNDPLNQNADQIRELAATYHVGLVDSLKGFQSQIAAGKKLADLMAQSNHPNRAGHEIVADLLAQWFP